MCRKCMGSWRSRMGCRGWCDCAAAARAWKTRYNLALPPHSQVPCPHVSHCLSPCRTSACQYSACLAHMATHNFWGISEWEHCQVDSVNCAGSGGGEGGLLVGSADAVRAGAQERGRQRGSRHRRPAGARRGRRPPWAGGAAPERQPGQRPPQRSAARPHQLPAPAGAPAGAAGRSGRLGQPLHRLASNLGSKA